MPTIISIILVSLSMLNSVNDVSASESQHYIIGSMTIVLQLLETDKLQISVSVPTDGWVAIGFNEVNSLRDARLFMMKYENDEVVLEEHITNPPSHHKITRMLDPNLKLIKYRQQNELAIYHFQISLSAGHYQSWRIESGKRIYMIAAYSAEKDFQHHSLFRQHVPITLNGGW